MGQKLWRRGAGSRENGKLACSFIPLMVRVAYGEPLGRWYIRFDILSTGFGGWRVGGLEDWRGYRVIENDRRLGNVECSWMIGAEVESRLEGQCGWEPEDPWLAGSRQAYALFEALEGRVGFRWQTRWVICYVCHQESTRVIHAAAR